MSNILYLEHTKARHGVEAALKYAGIHVDTVTEPDIKLLSEKLRVCRYDVVITDAFFLKEDADHVDGVDDGVYMLDKIVQEVRKVDNKRVKIVVLTNFSPALLTAHKDDLDAVDYLWDKASSGSDFIFWQITRILEEQKKGLPEHRLISKLIDLFSKPEGKELPWNEHMKNMLDAYRGSNLESQQIKDIKIYVIKIANELGIESSFKHIFDKVESAETLNVAANPLAWGHLRHAINVFWLGYYFLNCGAFDIKKIGDRLFGNNLKYDREKARMAVNATWFLTSLLHDIGLLGEKASSLIDRCNNIIKIYPLENSEIICPTGIKKLGDIAIHLADQVKTQLDKDVVTYFNSVYMQNKETIDHGVLSSLTILKLFDEKEIGCFYAAAAAAAAALHNCMNIGIEEEHASPINVPKIEFSSYPIAALLIICDQIEVWDRQTGYENDYNGLAIESCELSDLTVKKNDKGISDISITLNYVPFKSIAPDDVAGRTSQQKINEIISGKIKPSLDRIKISDDWHIKINILFKYNGREDLSKWPGGGEIR